MASCISLFQHDKVFLGSSFGDSICIQLSEEPTVNPLTLSLNNSDAIKRCFFKEVFRITNTGPIVDFTLMNSSFDGSSSNISKQIVACCGAFNESRLKTIRSDLTVQLATSGLFENYKTVPFDNAWHFPSHSLTVVTTYLKTLFIIQRNKEFIDVTSKLPESFSLSSLLVSDVNSLYETFIQVTSTSAKLFKFCSFPLKVESLLAADLTLSYNPNVKISFCHMFYDMLICVFIDNAKNQSIISFFKVSSSSFLNIGETPVSGQISAISSLEYKHADAMGILVYSTWEIPGEVVVSEITKDLKITNDLRYSMDNSILLIHSLHLSLFANSSLTPYLHIGTGSGQLYVYSLSVSKKFSLFLERQIGLGNLPVFISPYMRGHLCSLVFASSEHTIALFYSSSVLKHVFLTSNDDLFKNIHFISSSSTNDHASVHFHSFVAIEEKSPALLKFNLEDIISQHMQVRAYPMPKAMEMPIRIGHNEKYIVVLLISYEGRDLKNSNSSFLRFFDITTMKPVGLYEFPSNMQATSLAIINTSLLIVGCSIVPSGGDPEILEGSFLVFDLNSNIFSPVYEHKIPGNSKGAGGPVYSIADFKHTFLIIGVQAQILAFRIDSFNSFHQVGSKYAQILPMFLTVTPDNELLIGDIMKSISVVRIIEEEKNDGIHLSFDELGKEYASRWMTAQTSFLSNTYVGCDGEGNLFFLQRSAEANSIIEAKSLKRIGSFYIGDTVNKFQKGFISLPSEDNPLLKDANHLDCKIYATASGRLSFLTTLSPEDHERLSIIQETVRLFMPRIGDFDHRLWRYDDSSSKKVTDMVLDGDLIKSIMELPKDSSLLAKMLKKIMNSRLFDAHSQIFSLVERYSALF